MKKKPKKISENTSQMVFNNITANAIDYLKNSIDEFEEKPKYSLIHFITSLELFIKARLLKEHWTLLLDNVDKGNVDNFIQGQLFTIDFETAIARLSNIIKQPLTAKEFECFDKLRIHRNKLIHFFNKEYSGKSQKVKGKVLHEFCEGWFYLHRLLTEKWNNEFNEHLNQIHIINRKIARNKNFWKGKFNALKEDVFLQEKKGFVFEHCYICGFNTAKLTENPEHLYEGKCLICNTLTHWLEVECPNEDCGETIYINDSYSHCKYCDEEISLDYLLEIYEPYTSTNDDSYGSEETYCSECYETEASIVEICNNFLCLSCFTLFDELSWCGWCNTRYAGEMGEGSHYFGCEHCEGSAGWHRDD